MSNAFGFSTLGSSIRKVPALYKSHPILLTCLFLVTEALNQYFIFTNRLLTRQFEQESAWLIVNELGSFISSSLADGVLILIIPLILNHARNSPSTRLSMKSVLMHHVAPVTIEMIRATASVIRWGLLFLFPGLFKHLTFLFVPFVVMFSRDYQEGTSDALLASSQLLRGQLLKVAFILSIFAVFELSLFNSLSETFVLDQPFIVVGMSALKFVLDVFFYTFMYNVFEKLCSQKGVALA